MPKEKPRAPDQAPMASFIYRFAPIFSFVITELLNRTDTHIAIRPLAFLANLLWYLGFYFLASVLSGSHRRIGACIAASVLFLLALINHYTLRFRGRTLAPSDLLHSGTALNVARSYDLTPDGWQLAAIALFALLLFLLIRFPMRGRSPMTATRRIILSMALLSFFVVFLFTSIPADLGVSEDVPQSENRGFINEFFISLRYSFLHKPDNYSEEAAEALQEEIMEEMDEVLDESTETVAGLTVASPVNVIVIMNESLADYSVFPGFSASEDPLSFYHSLPGHCITGCTVSPVYGGGTANAEYEFLTANSCSFLPEGSIAYQEYLDSETPSMADFAREEGYHSLAFHPFLSSSWNREEAYALLGFEEQHYEESVSDAAFIGSYVSDACDYRNLIRMTESSTDKLFLFNVTIQNHGGYEEERENLDSVLTLSPELAEADPQAETYFNLVRSSDAALEELLTYYTTCPEPTLICLFGDHQPTLSEEFYDVLYGKPEEERSGREKLLRYTTPFLIWANYEIPVQSGLTISIPELGILLADTAGFSRSYYTAMLAEIYEELPVIHRYGFLTKDGSFAPDRDSLNSARCEMVDACEILQYHSLFDRTPGDTFYQPDEALGE